MRTATVRVIDRRKYLRSRDCGMESAINRTPFEIQIREHGQWSTVPGAYYASRGEAKAAIHPSWVKVK